MKSSKSKKKPTKATPSKARVAVKAPAAIGTRVSGSPPRFLGGRTGIRIKHRELIGTFSNGGAVDAWMIPSSLLVLPGPGDVNPGNHLCFPWLSHVATNFEKYRFESLKFHFQPTVASSTDGRYYVSFDYDIDDPVPASLQNQMSCRTCSESSIWMPQDMSIMTRELNEDMQWRYVNTTTRTSYQEPRTAYCGCWYLSMITSVDNVNVDVWVDYDISLSSPAADTEEIISQAGVEMPVGVIMTPTGTGTKILQTERSAVSTQGGPIKVVSLDEASQGAEPPASALAFTGQTLHDLWNASNLQGSTFNLWDISETKGKGLVQQKQVHKYGSNTISDFLTADYSPVAYVLDTALNVLGFVSKESLSTDFQKIGQVVRGSGGLNGPTTAGASLVNVLDMKLPALFSQFPSVRYLLPVTLLTSVIGGGSATARLGYTYTH